MRPSLSSCDEVDEGMFAINFMQLQSTNAFVEDFLPKHVQLPKAVAVTVN